MATRVLGRHPVGERELGDCVKRLPRMALEARPDSVDVKHSSQFPRVTPLQGRYRDRHVVD